jgi:hypothetical protein
MYWMQYPRPFAVSFTAQRALALLFALALLYALPMAAARAQSASDEDEGGDSAAHNAKASAIVAERLASRDPLERQRAAEELARTAAVEQQRLVAGYRLQEKDARVRLALDWALYRMGKTETLFAIVRSLDGSRGSQAASYLTQLEGPEPLYVFLDRVNDDTRVHLLEILAQLGDDKTIERINPYASYMDTRVANAAQFAIREITRRQSQPAQATRPRQTGNTTQEAEEEENQPAP